MNACEQIIALIQKAIETRDYNYIREAGDIAYENGIEMNFDDDYTMVYDEVYYHENIF